MTDTQNDLVPDLVPTSSFWPPTDHLVPRPLPYGGRGRSQVVPDLVPTPGRTHHQEHHMTDCTNCLDFLQRRGNKLLPLIGTEVTKTGHKPDKVVDKLLNRYHRLGHPTPSTPPPPPTEATKALRRLASRKKANP